MSRSGMLFYAGSFFVVINLFFQNCSQSETEFVNKEGSLSVTTTSTTTTSTTTTTQETPPCEKKLNIYSDPLNNGVALSSNLLGEINTFQGAKTGAENYGYSSASAHPLVGPQPLPDVSNVFLYEGSDGLSLTFFHNIDEGGSPDNAVFWKIKISGNDLKDLVLLSDDPGELVLTESDKTNKINFYTADMHYWKNTDGGVIGPFVGKDYKIQVEINPAGIGNIKNVQFYSSNNKSFPLLKLGYDIKTASFIIIYGGCQ